MNKPATKINVIKVERKLNGRNEFIQLMKTKMKKGPLEGKYCDYVLVRSLKFRV